MFLMFDLDGTLLDPRADLCNAVNFMRGEYGLEPLSLEIVAGFVGNGVRKLAERSLRGTGVDVDEALPVLQRRYLEHIHDATTLYPGVKNGLSMLKNAGFKLALISNKPEDPCRVLLNHFGLEHFFAIIAGGDTFKTMKPSPDPVWAAMKTAEAEPESSWMIGDHNTDLEAARRARVKSGFVSYGIGDKGLETPDKVFDSFSQLTEFFLCRQK